MLVTLSIFLVGVVTGAIIATVLAEQESRSLRKCLRHTRAGNDKLVAAMQIMEREKEGKLTKLGIVHG